MNTDGIVLLAKQPGMTSFTSLHSVKKALGTSKVGHTGTLDSFAQGLLVVCTGRLTRLSGNITEFNKTYKAILKFGEETDTLEYTGEIIKTASLPSLETLNKAVSKYTGTFLQTPPLFSAIHINGMRASDLARQGENAEIPPRQINVFSAKILDTRITKDNFVEYALIEFSVSKGTYIRSLARDIGRECNSAAHLAGLFRTKVGNFDVTKAVNYSDMNDFNIENTILEVQKQKRIIEEQKKNQKKHQKYVPDQKELHLQQEIINNIVCLSEETAVLCGFEIIHLISNDAALSFKNGKNLLSRNFDKNLHELSNNSTHAVFYNKDFLGLIEKNSESKIRYKFVIN